MGRLFSFFVLFFALASCSTIVDQHGWVADPVALAKLKPGVTTQQGVEDLLGTPSSKDLSGRTWYYVSRVFESQTTLFRAELKESVVYVLTFSGRGILTKIEKEKGQGRSIEPVSEKTPSAEGRSEGALKRVFKNFGRVGDSPRR